MKRALKIIEPLGESEWLHITNYKHIDLYVENPFDEKKLLRLKLKDAVLDLYVKYDESRFKNTWEFMESEEYRTTYVHTFSASIIVDDQKNKVIPCKVSIKPYQKVDIGEVTITESNVKHLRNVHEWWKKPEVRDLSKTDVLKALTRMQPIVERQGKYFNISMSKILKNPTEVGFTWSPRRTTERNGLTVLKKIITHHSDPMPPNFRPDVVEVINQIPDEDFSKCVAFMTDPETAQQGGRYDFIAETTLFTN